MKTGDRLICVFVEPQTVGRQFTKWLLHITIVPWFRLDDGSEQLAEGLKQALTSIAPFTVVAGAEVRFGPQKNRPANLVEKGAFPAIEQRTRSYLHKKRAWLVDETTKRRRQFRPHVTFQGDERLHEGDAVCCDRLYIVEQKGDYKEIMAEVPLVSTAA